MKRLITCLLVPVILLLSSASTFAQKSNLKRTSINVTHEELLDHIYGGWTGMLIGGIEGLPHEFKYNAEPRPTLPEFTFLKDVARTDDDNDFELTHLWFMDKENSLMIPYTRIVEICKAQFANVVEVADPPENSE